jgi:cytoskeleton protein RodZ
LSDVVEKGAASESGTALAAGALLRAARERAGWTAERLAAEMCLSVSRLHALEADDHASLGGAVFVRGYLRRAAGLLGVSPQELVAACEATGGGHGPAAFRPVHTPGARPRRGLPAWAGPLAGVTTIVAVVAGGGWWLDPELDATPRGSAATGASLDFTMPEPPALAPRIALQEPAPAPVAGGADDVPLSAAEPVHPQLVQEPEPALPAPGTVELRLVFSEDCWLEITDADDARVAYRLYRSGEVARLRGKAPMTIFLGNADGVQLSVDGAAMAVRPASRRDGTARLTVGGGAG